MQIISFETKIVKYDSLSDLSETDQRLVEKAKEATRLSYAPYSNFRVGAAALLEKGEIAQGANQENAAYPMCLCAEMVLLSTISASHNHATIQTIAITADSSGKGAKEPVAPCGACRQTLLEYENRQTSPIRILLLGENGIIYEMASVKDLLPLSFDESFLSR